MGKEVSFVIPTVNEGDNLCATIQSLRDTTEVDYEIVVVDNGSNDSSTDFIEREGDPRIRLFKTGKRLGVSGARNFGAAFAEGDFLVFADAHVVFYHNWLTFILDALRNSNVGLAAPAIGSWDAPEAKGYGMKWSNTHLDAEWLGLQSMEPYPVPLSCGCCQAFRWDVFHEMGGYDPGMINWGHEDHEICLRTWLLGYQVVVVPQAETSHLFRGSAPYNLNWLDSTYNLLRTVYAHLSTERIERIIPELKSIPAFDKAVGRLNTSDIWNRRRTLEVRRKRDDDWYFSTFDINC